MGQGDPWTHAAFEELAYFLLTQATPQPCSIHVQYMPTKLHWPLWRAEAIIMNIYCSTRITLWFVFNTIHIHTRLRPITGAHYHLTSTWTAGNLDTPWFLFNTNHNWVFPPASSVLARAAAWLYHLYIHVSVGHQTRSITHRTVGYMHAHVYACTLIYHTMQCQHTKFVRATSLLTLALPARGWFNYFHENIGLFVLGLIVGAPTRPGRVWFQPHDDHSFIENSFVDFRPTIKDYHRTPLFLIMSQWGSEARIVS
jgi:hypothetical protein